jgi:hypothetical protein
VPGSTEISTLGPDNDIGRFSHQAAQPAPASSATTTAAAAAEINCLTLRRISRLRSWW